MDQEWETELRSVSEAISTVTRYRGKLADGPETLLACLEAQEKLMERFMKVSSYASLKLSADGTSHENQIASGRVSSLGAEIHSQLSFVRSEILALPEATLQRYFVEEPRLSSFRRSIEQLLDQKPYILHPETEKALAALGEVLNAPSMIYARSKSADISFEPVVNGKGEELPMSFAVYENSYERSSDPVLRRNAFKSFTTGLKAYQNTWGALWGTEVKRNVVMAKLRGFPSATHMLLHAQEVPLEVYNNLHDVILRELAPHMRRYARLRKTVLKLDKMLYCDIEAPLDPQFNPATTYAEASEIIMKGLSVLGPEYSEVIAQGLHNRWIDLADNIGKSTGAFCNCVYGVHPYVLITWTDNMRNALTLAHELGHAGHGVLSQRNQRFSNCRTSMFFVEAPSTLNELLVGEYILSQATDVRLRRWVIVQLLTTYYHNFVRHLIEGELQRRIYAAAEKGQPVTASLLSKVQGEILDEFWGGEVEIEDGARLTWMRQPHYYMGLYPYTYSAGLTISTTVARAIRREGAPAVERWLEVLKAGGTKKPLELAEMAGVNMSRPDPMREAVAHVGSLVDELVRSF